MAMSVGIIAYGCAFPRGEVRREGRTFRVAAHDEDAITLALAAIDDAGPIPDPQAILFASLSLPYSQRVQGGLIAESLGIGPGVLLSEHTTSARAGTEALSIGIRLASEGPVLVVASEAPPAEELRSGSWPAAGAAAIVLGPIESGTEATIAVLSATTGHDVAERPGLDFRLRGAEAVEDLGVADYARAGFLAAAGAAVRHGPEGDWDTVVVEHPDDRLADRLCRDLGLPDKRWRGSAIPGREHLGAAAPILQLVDALDQCQPGQRILVVGYGGGSAADAIGMTVATASSRARLVRALGVARPIGILDLLGMG